MIRELLGKAAGKLPAQFQYDCWVLADEVPSFVKFEGPLQLMGPIVRIELVSPHLLTKRILTTLLYALKRTGGKRGIASLCIGGGGAVALAVELC
jgi:Thiolase, C-terminal domain